MLVGEISMRQSLAPVSSRFPVRIMSPRALCTRSWCLLIETVQSASQIFPMLIKLLVKPGIIYPVLAACVGMAAMANWACAIDVRISPVAVRMVVCGAEESYAMSGAASVK